MVVGVTGDELSHPASRRLQLTRGPASDQLQVLARGAARVGVDVDGVQIVRDERHQPGELVTLAVEDLVNRQLAVLLLSVDAWRAVAEEVGAEPELLPQNGVLAVGALHVLIHLADGDQEVELVGEDDARQEHHEADDGGVLKVGELHLAGPELHTPADVATGGWRLEAHRLPVGRLDVLKMVHVDRVILMHLLREERDGLTDKQVSHVRRQKVINTALTQSRQQLIIHHKIHIIIRPTALRYVRIRRAVPRLRYDEPIGRQRLQPSLLIRPAVAGHRDHVPAAVCGQQMSAVDR